MGSGSEGINRRTWPNQASLPVRRKRHFAPQPNREDLSAGNGNGNGTAGEGTRSNGENYPFHHEEDQEEK